jgi:uncharacterized alpha-E superfamily protein
MPNVATWWCGQPAARDLVDSELENLAIAPAFNGLGPDGVSTKPRLMADLSSEQREAFLTRFNDRPGDFVGQEVVQLSTTPVLRDGQLAPAPFVLRVYVTATPDGMRTMSGGFCRTSERPDVRAVSMDDDARTADVWVIAEKPVERVTLLASTDDVKVRRILGHLPSRAADNLFWLGRYLERAEATLRLVRSLCTSLMDSEAALHGAGETLARLQQLLIAWGALNEKSAGRRASAVATEALHDQDASGSVIALVRSARRTAASMRERLSADFWTLLLNLESRLLEYAPDEPSEAEALRQVEAALQILAALAGLSQENMNRGAGWRFLDMGRRIERGINTCRFTRTVAGGEATIDDLDLLLDLADSQITYRARYLVGLALTPVLDMVLLDPFNTRSAAFQVFAVKDHLASLPTLAADGMLEEPSRLLLLLATQMQTADASQLEFDTILAFEQTLMMLADAVESRYFLRGANAVPTARLTALA